MTIAFIAAKKYPVLFIAGSNSAGFEVSVFVLTLVIFKTPINAGPDPYRKGSIVNVSTYVATINYQETTPTHAPPWRR
jgi:hypothetical protein